MCETLRKLCGARVASSDTEETQYFLGHGDDPESERCSEYAAVSKASVCLETGT